MSRSRQHRPLPPTSQNGIGLWLFLAMVSAGTYALFYVRPGLFWFVGLQHYDIWFADTYALLASGDAVTQGLNPYLSNPLDFFGRPHVYSHWWLEIRRLGLTRSDISWLGPTVVIVAWLAALGTLRPRTGTQFAFALAILVSSPVLLAFERANNDLVIFLVLAPVVPCLRSSRPWVQLFGTALIALAAGLKYYPAIGGIMLLSAANSRQRFRQVILGIGLLAVVAANVAPDLAVFGPLAPKPSGWMSFGASTTFTSLGWTGVAPAVACVLGGAIMFVCGWRSDRLHGWHPGRDSAWLRFVLGAALLTGCFFASANFAYRWIFALWLPPLLWSMTSVSTVPEAARRFAKLTAWLLIAALWLDTAFTWVAIALQGHAAPDTIRTWMKVSLLAEQPVTWTFFGCLLFFLAKFIREALQVDVDPAASIQS